MEENGILEGQEAGVVNPQENGDAAAQDAEGGKSADNAGQSQQSHEDNRRYAAARRSGEQSGYARAMSEVDAQIAGMGMRNPNSGKLIENLEDLGEFNNAFRSQRIKQKAQETGRSEADIEEEELNREFISQARRRAETESKAQRSKDSAADFIRRDVTAFMEAYPDVDLGKLENNQAFRRFCGSRYGREPLADLYGDYLELAGSAQRSAMAKAESKQGRATGTGAGNEAAVSLTARQQKELDDWNREYPQMKMTAKEFLER